MVPRSVRKVCGGRGGVGGGLGQYWGSALSQAEQFLTHYMASSHQQKKGPLRTKYHIYTNNKN